MTPANAAVGVPALADLGRYAPGVERQLRALREHLDAGMPRRGWKVGINVPEVLERLGLAHSGLGWLHGGRAFASGATLGPPPSSKLRIEPELALRVKRRVRAAEGVAGIGAALDAVAPALEIVDYAQPANGIDDVVAHSMFHYGFVLGDFAPLEAVPPLGAGLPRLETLHADAPLARGDLVPADLRAVVLFAATFAEAFGESVEAGDLILSGSYTTEAVRLAPGDRVRADFGPLGSVEVAARAGH